MFGLLFCVLCFLQLLVGDILFIFNISWCAFFLLWSLLVQCPGLYRVRTLRCRSVFVFYNLGKIGVDVVLCKFDT